MKPNENENTFYAANANEWRNWLYLNHLNAESIWLIIYRKESGVPSVYYPEAVDEALCFGWIDSVANKRDNQSYYQFFSRRKLKSNWSKVNKLKVDKLLKQNKMMPQGLKMVAYAKESGTWEALNKVDELVIPKEMSDLFKNKQASSNQFQQFPGFYQTRNSGVDLQCKARYNKIKKDN